MKRLIAAVLLFSSILCAAQSTRTPNLNLYKPIPNVSPNWGSLWNKNADILDAFAASIQPICASPVASLPVNLADRALCIATDANPDCTTGLGTGRALCQWDATLGQWITVSTSAAGGTRTQYRVCEIHIWGSGAGYILQDSDDELASCANEFGVNETVTKVVCWANAGSPTVLPVVTGGSNLLSGNLTCGTNSYATGTLNGVPTLVNGGSIDMNIVSAGGVATNIRIAVTLSRVQ